ncbi:eCIS core domain-containing protein [Jidongwangia harbinensis]|uniref:eCIS core domain-containing protein n=1 Tax=Jidongwangia harbinensis TaxID=2878561 RepID=UPI001CD93A65|nr:DUF4157 domain-containing protein [Jidongwangia harbinensis]MCA2218005.1 DUF4157 domain-containing protein [Jidongwangia harbinensis]
MPEVLHTSGAPLGTATRAEMQARFGRDFSRVRIHTGPRAAEAAQAVNAQAFTAGEHVVFGAGRTDAASIEEEGLLAHELMHVLQQGDQCGPAIPLETSRPGDDAEREADRTAAMVGSGGMAPPVGSRGPKLYRQVKRPTPTPGARGGAADLQQRYGITIMAGDKTWSVDDLKALEWTLSKLSKQEALALKGYIFFRWSDAATRGAKDPTYQPQADEECGLHEADIAAGSYKISMYDKCFKDPEATSETMAGVPIERFHMLHEIGHAMEIAELRRAYESYSKAIDAYDNGAGEINDQSSSEVSREQHRRLEKRAKELDQNAETATKRYEVAKTRTITEFDSRIAGSEALTEYSKVSSPEAFAEAFALYKADPKGLKKVNRSLYDWFARQGHLNPLRSSTKSKAKPR